MPDTIQARPRPDRRAAVALPKPRVFTAPATFQGLFMRPNQSADATIPCSNPVSVSPDIWIVPNALHDPTTLTTVASYALESSDNVQGGAQNLIYVRAKNNAATPKTMTAALYYAVSGLIQQPSSWQGNGLQTTSGAYTVNLANVAPGAIAVGDDHFVWNAPQQPPAGNHYCLFAQLNDAANSNPFPSVFSPIDMAALIRNNLAWGWRNTTYIPSSAQFTVQETCNVPTNYPTPPAAGQWAISVVPTGWVGWSCALQCSITDSAGVVIQLNPTTIVTSGVGFLIEGLTLNPGWSGIVTIEMINPTGAPPPTDQGWKVIATPIVITSTPSELREAARHHLMDRAYNRAFERTHQRPPPVDPTAYLVQGGFGWKVDPTGQLRTAPGFKEI